MNNRTSWTLAVQDVQDGKGELLVGQNQVETSLRRLKLVTSCVTGYPGHELCNPVIPHAKWLVSE